MTHHHAMVLRMTIFYSFYFIELTNISSWPQFSGFLDGDMYHCQLFPHYAFILMQLLSGLNMFASLISDLWIAATECEKSFFIIFSFLFLLPFVSQLWNIVSPSAFNFVPMLMGFRFSMVKTRSSDEWNCAFATSMRYSKLSCIFPLLYLCRKMMLRNFNKEITQL